MVKISPFEVLGLVLQRRLSPMLGPTQLIFSAQSLFWLNSLKVTALIITTVYKRESPLCFCGLSKQGYPLTVLTRLVLPLVFVATWFSAFGWVVLFLVHFLSLSLRIQLCHSFYKFSGTFIHWERVVWTGVHIWVFCLVLYLLFEWVGCLFLFFSIFHDLLLWNQVVQIK